MGSLPHTGILSTIMLPFAVKLKRGEPVPDQVLRAVHDALGSGQLRDGDSFPSARSLSQDLRISPSAAQRIITSLKEDGFLASQSDSGLIVRAPQRSATANPSSASQTVVVPGAGEGAAAAVARLTGQLQLPADIDHYTMNRLIARGGMGQVYEAQDNRLMRSVAIKILAPEFASSPEACRRFLREARAAAAVDHPNVLPIHAVGEFGNVPYLVMPLVQGESLQARLDREGPLPIGEIRRIGRNVARGLAAAHATGLIHRDIKPDNVLLEKGTDRMWLADFGLARSAEDLSLTRTGVTPGTPQYLSPEQAEGSRDIDFRSDLFSLGAMLYTMATGTPPFNGPNIAAIVHGIVDKSPEPPATRRLDLPGDIAQLIEQCLAKKPSDRPPSAEIIAGRITG